MNTEKNRIKWIVDDPYGRDQKVIFRKFKNGEIIALFPEIAGNMDPSTMMSYQHVGQHGAADCIGSTKLATPDEYSDLAKELETIGYVLKVCKKATYKDFLKRKDQVK